LEIHEMKNGNRKLALVSSIALALGIMVSGVTASANSQSTVSEQAAEASRETRILTSFNMNRHLRGYDLSAKVDGDKATLSGKVEDGVAKDLAEQIAQGVDGIKKVDNRIVIDPGYVHAKREGNERGFGETVDDATITASVKSKLLWNSHTDGLDIHVDTNNRQVTLTGNANSSTEKDLAGRITRDTGGVIGVKNNIAVNGKPSNSATVKTGNDAPIRRCRIRGSRPRSSRR
jgi:osmotically-inducible protein OsmY